MPVIQRNIAVCLLLLLGATTAAAQSDTSSAPPTHLIQHALFVCPDTSYEITYVLTEELLGHTFSREWLYPENFRWHGMGRLVLESDTSARPLIFSSVLLPGVDTLRSVFSTNEYGPATTDRIGNTEYTTDYLTEDAFLAFALRAYGLVTPDTATAYYFGKLDDASKDGGARFVLCAVEGWRGLSPRFIYTLGQRSPDGLRVIERGELQVPRKEMDRLRRQLIVFVGTKWESCLYGSYMVEKLLMVGNNRIVSSEHCRDGKKRRHTPDALWGISSIYWRYGLQH